MHGLISRFFCHVSAVQFLIIVITVLLTVGILTCVLNHYKMGARSWSDYRNRQQNSTGQSTPQQQFSYTLTPTTPSIMFTSANNQDRQTGALQDHIVRMSSVQNDMALNLPHSVTLPDGEEGPACNMKMQDPELTRSFIRAPPNRTVPDCGAPIPFPIRSNSIGKLPKQSEPTVMVTRSHSISNSNGCATPKLNPSVWVPSPVVIVPIGTLRCNRQEVSDPPPPYSDVVNQWSINTVCRQQNSGV